MKVVSSSLWFQYKILKGTTHIFFTILVIGFWGSSIAQASLSLIIMRGELAEAMAVAMNHLVNV